MPKGKYKRLRCHKNILIKNLKHNKFTLADSEKLMFRYDFGESLKKRINKIRNVNISNDLLNKLISTGKAHYFKKRKIPRIEDHTLPIWHLWVYGGNDKSQLVKQNLVKETSIRKILNYNKEELKEKMLGILKERNQNPDDWHFYAWFKNLVL